MEIIIVCLLDRPASHPLSRFCLRLGMTAAIATDWAFVIAPQPVSQPEQTYNHT